MASLRESPSRRSSKTSSHLLIGSSSGKVFAFFLSALGGNSGSKAMRKALSSMAGMIRAKRGQESSRQGFVFASIR